MTKNTMQVHTFYNSGICNGIKEETLRPEWKKGRAMMLMECKTVEMKKGKKYGSLSALFMREMKPVVDKISSTPFEAIFPEKIRIPGIFRQDLLLRSRDLRRFPVLSSALRQRYFVT